jgi:hypothetical protein
MEGLNFKIGTEKSPILISLKTYKGRKLLDIRKYYHDRSQKDKILPTKKGISLNVMQLENLIKTLNDNRSSINNFYNNNEIINEGINIEVKEETLIGRNFNLEFKNNKKSLSIDSSISEKIESDKLDLFKTLILSFYDSLYDVIEEDDEIELVLDRLGQKLNKIKW